MRNSKFKFSRGLALAALCMPLLLATGCGGGDEDDSGDVNNGGITLPANLTGRAINYTVTDPGTAGIPAGRQIQWNFNAGGVITGKNPVSGVVYTPYNFVYTANKKNGEVRVNYTQGATIPYEIYSMTATSETKGTYTYQGDTGSGVKTAAGTYEIIK